MINDVLTSLQEEGIRCQRSFPVGKMPYLTGPVVAVNLAKTQVDLTTLAVHIYAPLRTGGIACEDMAIRVVRILDDLRGDCQVQECQFDGDMGLFHMTIFSTFLYHLARDQADTVEA